MALFFFHIDDGLHHTADTVGVELPNVRAARVEAAVLAGELLKDRPDEFWEIRSWTMTVTDADDLTLFTIHVEGAAAPAVVQQLRLG